MYQLKFESKAWKSFDKLEQETQHWILRKLNIYINAPSPLAFAHRLKDSELGTYRFRVGDYRIIFDLVEDTIVILRIGHRREIYKS